jgi:ABC-type molybdate transport system ATPase subunit
LRLTRLTEISALNVLGQVEKLVPIAESTLEVQLRVSDRRLLARITRRSGRALVRAPGRQVFAAIKNVAIDRCSFSRQNPTADLEGETEEVFDS